MRILYKLFGSEFLFSKGLNIPSSHYLPVAKKRYKVFITRTIPGAALPLLKKYFQVKVYPKDEKISRIELLKGVKWCDALLCLLTEKIDREVIDANPNLKVISNYAVGYNNIDVAYATKKGIPVCNTPSQQMTDGVAEHAVALILGVAKRIHEAEQVVRQHTWKSWAPSFLLGTLLTGKTLGIVGLGRIGAGVAARMHALGMKIFYTDVKHDAAFEQQLGAQYLPLAKVLQQADVVTLHVPLLPETRHLINTKTLHLMKKTAYLINTSRGEVVEEQALITALRKKQIAGAGLDVYESEPQVNPLLTTLSNCLLTPHTASATLEVREQMSLDAANNIIAIVLGKGKAKVVNPEVHRKRP